MEKNKLTWIIVIIIILIVAFFIYTYFKGGENEDTKGLFARKPQPICTSNGFECGDCIDNDGDGKIDYLVDKKGRVTGDSDCDSLTDDCESVSCCTPTTCSSLGIACGPASNGCGGILNCGTCSSPLICIGGTCEEMPSNQTS